MYPLPVCMYVCMYRYVAYCCMFIMIFIDHFLVYMHIRGIYKKYTRVGDFDTPIYASAYKYVCMSCMCRTGPENILPFTEVLSTAAVRRGLLLSMLTIKVAAVCSCVPINKLLLTRLHCIHMFAR